jgi:methylmalonyl-CoA mutase cobalamin-binding subunit
VLDVKESGVWSTVGAALAEILERRGHFVVVSSIYDDGVARAG